MSLLTDAGAAPAGSLTPGNGSQQNSQCVLNGAGSSVSTTGNALTVNLALTFLAAFTGMKNVYMDAANPYATVNWQVEGTWVAAQALSLSVTPASGNATQQTFSLQVSDPLGAADLTTVGLLFNSSASTTSACTVLFNRTQSTLTLLTDAGATPASSITPGSGSQQNSQCVLNGAGSSVATSGNVLALTLALSFQPGFSGTKGLYAEAIGISQAVNWQQEGIWTSPPIVTMAVTPSSGVGAQQQFSFQATDSLAAGDLTTVGVLLNSTASGIAACAVTYDSAQNTLALLTDTGAQPASSISPGSGTQQNSQCQLSGSGSSVSLSANTLTLDLALTFQTAFTGAKNVYMEAANPYETLSWQAVGAWVAVAPPAMSVSPASGNATQQTFNLQVSDPLGAADLTSVGLLFNSTASVAAACAVTYNRAQNTLTLLTDAGAPPATSITPGSGSQQNSQCVLNGAGSSVSASGNTLTLNVALSFQPPFSGTKNLYAEASASYQTLSWQLEGSWSSPPIVTMSASPASGGGMQQTFTFQVTDSLAATDLTTIGVLFTSTVSTTSACAITYNRAQNTLMLLTDAGTPPGNAMTPGSGAQQNSQCTLNGSGSSVITAGITLTLNLSLSFSLSWVGTKTIYMEAVNPYQSGTWTSEGGWVTSASLTASESPTSGSGASATFAIQATESWGATHVTAAGILINTSTSDAGGCVVTYDGTQNTLTLLTDAGTAPANAIAPGSGTQQNSQCVLHGAGSSMTAVSAVLTVT